jgi:diacylglycerol kinase
VVALGFFVGLAPRDWAVLVLTIGLVLAAESINTVIEMVVNLACPEYHQLAKRAKDASAGIVLFLAVISVIIGLLILGPPLIRRLF